MIFVIISIAKSHLVFTSKRNEIRTDTDLQLDDKHFERLDTKRLSNVGHASCFFFSEMNACEINIQHF